MGTDFFNGYVDNFYDSSADYWKLTKNGNGTWYWADDLSEDFDIIDLLNDKDFKLSQLNNKTAIFNVLFSSMNEDKQKFGVISFDKMTTELISILGLATMPRFITSGQNLNGLYYPSEMELLAKFAREEFENNTIAIIRMQTMKTAQNIVMAANIYKQGAGGRWGLIGRDYTFCNQATFDVAEALGFNLDALYNGENRDLLRANDAVQNLLNAVLENKIISIDGAQAQYLANIGYLVIAAMENPNGSGHLASVRPSDSPYDNSKGPWVANVGATINDVSKNYSMYTIYAFGTRDYINNRVKYYYDPNQRFTNNINLIAQRQY